MTSVKCHMTRLNLPKMLFRLFCAALFIVSASASGELTILHHPTSLVFKGHDHVKESILKELYSASLGFSTEQYSNWDGLFIEDPFNLPRAVVTVAVDGVADVGGGKGHHFPLRTDEDELEVFAALQRRVSERFPESESSLIRVDLADGLRELHKHEVFEGVKHDKPRKGAHQLRSGVDEDRQFLKEVALLDGVAEAVERLDAKSGNYPDVYWFKLASLHPLLDLYGENSTQVKEAKQLLNDATSRLNNAFNKVYKGRVLVSVIASDAIHTRRARNILEEKDAKAAADNVNVHNIAKFYSKDYPVIFNIILWFGVIMVFTLLAICIAIAEMDPGRDSIIYRMTSTRLKKDN